VSRAEMGRWLLGPPVAGYWAVLWALLAVAIPFALRASLEGTVTGVAITPFVPFVMLSGVFLNWKYAAGVAVADGLIADLYFIGPPGELMEGPTDIFALAVFLLISTMIIGFAQLVRKLLNDGRKRRRANELSSGIVFSLERGEAWAGWRGQSSRVRLGPEDEVAEMMEDFLAQLDLGKRFSDQKLQRRA
jgi:hypothetical protein